MKSLILSAAALLLAAALPAHADEAMAKKYQCTTCHVIKGPKTIGPAYADVAKKYTGQKDAEAKLVEKVKKGRSSTLTRIERQKKRSFGIGNRGKFSKVPGGDKPTKRINVRYRCLKCKKATLRPGYKVQTYDLVDE